MIIYVSFFILLSCLLSAPLKAQIVESGKSESTIITDNTTLGVDIGKTELSFYTNNYTTSIISHSGFLWGGKLIGGNKEGIASLVSKGAFEPSFYGGIVLGTYFSNGKKIANAIKSEKSELISAEQKNLEKALKNTLQKEVDSIIDKPVRDKTDRDNPDIKLSTTESTKLKKVVKEALSTTYNTYKTLVSEVKIASDDNTETLNYRLKSKEVLDYLEEHKDLNKFLANGEVLIDISKRIRVEFGDILAKEDYWKFTLFATGGISSQNFNLFKGWDETNLDNSFSKKEFKGSRIGLGVNFRKGLSSFVGFRYTYLEDNNTALLSLTEYERTQSTTLNNITYTNRITKKAYSSSYSNAYLNRFDFDYLWFEPIGQNNLMLIDLYARHVVSNNNKIYPSQTTTGVSSSFFKKDGKFIGGLYLELPDVDQNVQRQKDVPVYDFWYNRLSFGIYVKYSFKPLEFIN